MTTTQLALCALTACLLYAAALTVQHIGRRRRGERRYRSEKVKYPQKGW